MKQALKKLIPYIKKYKRSSFFVKYLIIILTIIMVPIITILSLTIHTINYTAETEAKKNASIQISKYGSDLQNVFMSLNTLVAFGISSPSVSSYVSKDIASMPIDEQRSIISDLDKTFDIYILANDYIYSIDIYNHKNDSFYTICPTGNYNSELYNKVRTQYGTAEFSPIFSSTAKRREKSIEQEIICFSKELKYNNKPLGLFIVNLNKNKLSDLFKSEYRDNKIVLCDSNGEIFFDMEGYTGKHISHNDKFYKVFLDCQLSSSNTTVSQKGYAYKIFNPDVTLMMSNESFRTENAFLQTITIVLISIIVLVFALLLAVYVTLYFYGTIFKILQKFEDTNLLGTQSEKNELNLIDSIIDQTIADKTIMEIELNQKRSLLEKTHFFALQSQINPHFISNTLQVANAVVIADLKRDNDATVILSSLAELLRSALKTDEYLVSVSDEIEYVKKYYTIQNIRYCGRLNLVLHISPDTYNCQMLKLSLQPFVENAIIHGIIPTCEKGDIIISTKIKNNKLVIRVYDTGSGIPNEDLLTIRNRISNKSFSDNSHIGISNVAQRYQLLFGEESYVSIKSSKHGTLVKISIPNIQTKDDAIDFIN